METKTKEIIKCYHMYHHELAILLTLKEYLPYDMIKEVVNYCVCIKPFYLKYTIGKKMVNQAKNLRMVNIDNKYNFCTGFIDTNCITTSFISAQNDGAYLELKIDPTNTESNDLKTLHHQIATYFNNEDRRKELFGDNYKSFKYDSYGLQNFNYHFKISNTDYSGMPIIKKCNDSRNINRNNLTNMGEIIKASNKVKFIFGINCVKSVATFLHNLYYVNYDLLKIKLI